MDIQQECNVYDLTSHIRDSLHMKGDMSLPRDLVNQINTFSPDRNTSSFFSLSDLVNESLDLGIDPRKVLNDAINDEYRCRRLRSSDAQRVLSLVSNYQYGLSNVEDELIIEITSTNRRTSVIIADRLRDILRPIEQDDDFQYEYHEIMNEYIDVGTATYSFTSLTARRLYDDIEHLIKCSRR